MYFYSPPPVFIILLEINVIESSAHQFYKGNQDV